MVATTTITINKLFVNRATLLANTKYKIYPYLHTFREMAIKTKVQRRKRKRRKGSHV
jgi:hypothetical protein